MLKGLKKPWRQALAGLMAALLVLGVIPVDAFGGILRASAEGTTYELSADDVDLTDGLTEGIKAGTENYFTLNTGMKVTSSEKTIDDKSFTKRMQTTGAGDVDNKSIKFKTNNAATIVIYAAQSGGDAGNIRHVVLMKDDGTLLATSPDMAKGGAADSDAPATRKFTMNVDAAGTYYLTADVKGIDIYHVAVTEEAASTAGTAAEISADNLETTDGLTEGLKAGTDNYFTLNTGMKVTATNKTIDDKSFTQRMQTTGAGDVDNKSIKFTTNNAATIVIYAAQSGGDAGEIRHVVLKKDDGTLLATSPDMAKGGAADSDAPATRKFTMNVDAAGTYYLTADVKGIDIYFVSVTEEASTAAVSFTPSITGLADGQSVALYKGGEKKYDLVNGTEISVDKTSYDLVVLKGDAVDSDSRASVAGETNFSPADYEGAAAPIVVSSSTVTVAVSLAEGSVLTAGNTITAVNKDDSADSVALTPGSTAKLKIDATYEFKTSDTDYKATSGGKASIKVTSDLTAISLTLENTVVKPSVKVNDKVGMTGYTLTLTNSADSADVHNYTEADGFGKLQIGATYALTMTGSTNAEAVATMNSDTNITITAGMTAIVVKIEVPSTDGLIEVDITEGLLADKGLYYADGQIAVGEDMPYKATDKSVQGSNNAKQLDNPSTNVNASSPIPGSGAYVKIVPKQDGRFKVEVKAKENATLFTDTTEDGTKLANNTVFGTGSKETKVFNVQAGHTYYLSAQGSKPTIYYMALDYRPQVDWDSVSSPELLTPVINAEKGTITVPYMAEVGGISSDSLLVRMLDSKGDIAATETTTDTADSGTVEFTPAASGDYTFQAFLQRANELDKESNTVTATGFKLPMAKPVLNVPENMGSGTVRVTWGEVSEAQNYTITLMDAGKNVISTQELTQAAYTFKGLTVGASYIVSVVASGNGYKSEAGVSDAFEVTAQGKKSWDFASFGQGVDAMKSNGVAKNYDSSNNAASGSVEEGSVKLKSYNSKGKLVPASTDGLAFYYTTIDPTNENFTLSADVTVNKWQYTNGQEGFGLMAADRVGQDGDSSVFWNNSYMTSVTKVEYFWDREIDAVSNAGYKYSMKLGVGAQEKIGVTHENIADESAVNVFSTNMYTLDTSMGEDELEAGTYNRVGNYTNTNDLGDYNPVTTFHLELQRNNTGYFLSYTENGKTTTKKFYHGDDGDELTKLDANNIYIGFFASRSVDVTFSNIVLTTINPADDAPAEGRPISYVNPTYTVESAKTANTSDYDLVYYGNATGYLRVVRGDDEVIYSGAAYAEKKLHIPVTLNQGSNSFTLTMTPNEDYYPSKYERLSSYEPVEFTHSVTYSQEDRDVIWVGPNGGGAGYSYDPMEISRALKNAKPGQTIVMLEGTYKLETGLTIDRGINGGADNTIKLIADPDASSRPVLDFQKLGSGLMLAGDYWYLQGFDVTNSTGKGLQVSGDHNVVDQVNAYRNGNTGIQIARYKSTDEWEDWPSYNLILNCTSHNNADPGYEDADGFAAKLTCADGNVFDGCIAYYNADDGWDLFAKPEDGPIGVVTLRNCVTYKNGYVQDPVTGEEVNAGNGNGFKMGGSSISGYHVLENSVAFANKAKGIDSNSCPDIQVFNSTSFDNESNNVAFYTNDAKNTDFEGTGILSYKISNTVAENLKAKGKQDTKKIYKDSSYYFNGSKSVNASGDEASLSWFVNYDVQKAINGGITRNADGTVNMNGFLVLTDAAPSNTGARINGTASAVFASPERDVKEDDEEETVTTNSGAVSSQVPVSNHVDTGLVVLTDEISARVAAGLSRDEYLLAEVDPLQSDNPAIKLLKSAASKAKLTMATYFDVNLYKITEDGERRGQISELKAPISLLFSVPSDLDGNQYDFGVVRVHNGATTLLKDMDNDPLTITVLSDQFSAYAIVYGAKGSLANVKAGTVSTAGAAKSGSSPKTFDSSKFVPEVPAEELAKFVQHQEVEDLLITPQANKFPFGIVIAAMIALALFLGGEVIYFGRKKRN